MASYVGALFVVCVFTVPEICKGLQWASPSDLTNGSTVEACEGDTVPLPWSFTTDPAEHLLEVQWFFQKPGGASVSACCKDQDGWEKCIDKHQDGCQGIYEPWARAHCQAYCGYCEPCPIEPCVDTNSYCEQFGDDSCTNPLTRLWAYQNCLAHCGLCDNYGFYWSLNPSATRSAEGQTSQLLATFSAGNFQKAPTAKQMLEYVPNAGIRLLNVSSSDLGIYTVHVKVEVNGSEEEHVQGVVLAEPESLPKNYTGVLDARLLPEAVLDESTGEWHAQLSCGDFTDPEQTSLSVTWTAPSGNKLDGSDYRNGRFLLTLPNPVETGDYSCQVERHPTAGSCGGVASTLLEKATVTVKAVDVQLAILTARVEILEKDNSELRQENDNLRQQLKQSGSSRQDQSQGDCNDLLQNFTTSSIYTIYPDPATPISVYCDQDTDGGGWTVIQRRQDGSVNFNRDWADYEAGFGNLTGEFWLGLKNVHTLTSTGQYSLRVDLEDFDNSTAFGLYESFYIDGPDQNYRLHVAGYSGTAGDSLMTGAGGDMDRVHNGQPFSTIDSDNDNSPTNCAAQTRSGWWFNHCAQANLNGQYGHAGDSGWAYIVWYSWHEDFRSYRGVEMKIRPHT